MAVGKIHGRGEVDISALLEEFKGRVGDSVGAIGSFVGIVRRDAKKGGEVEQLHFECAEDAGEDLEKIALEIEETFSGISEVAIHHIVDDLKPKDDILYVLVGGDHRDEVFEALPRIMDKIKEEPRIWKKEITRDESYWMHEIERS